MSEEGRKGEREVVGQSGCWSVWLLVSLVVGQSVSQSVSLSVSQSDCKSVSK